MQNQFNERLMQIMNYLEISSLRGFSKKIGISFSKLQSYQRGSSPGLDVLNIILSNLKDISPEWLITGQGKMIKTEGMLYEEETPYKRSQNIHLEPDDQKTLMQLCDCQKNEIKELKEELKEKNKQLGDLIKTNLLLLEREKGGGINHRGVDIECGSVG